MKNLYSLTILFFLVASVASGQDIYLKADGLTDQAGPSGDYFNYSSISSCQLGLSAEPGTKNGAPAPGLPVFDRVIITKNVDLASNKLLTLVTLPRGIETMEIIHTQNREGSSSVVHKIELKDVIIAKISTSTIQGCEGGCPAIAESYELVYTAIRITTYSQDGSGKWGENPTKFVWNVATKKPIF